MNGSSHDFHPEGAILVGHASQGGKIVLIGDVGATRFRTYLSREQAIALKAGLEIVLQPAPAETPETPLEVA